MNMPDGAGVLLQKRREILADGPAVKRIEQQGVRRAPLASMDDVVDTILETLVADRGLGAGSRVAPLVNGLDGTPPMELAIGARRALQQLRARGIVVERAWAGNFMTALEMPGISLSPLSPDDGHPRGARRGCFARETCYVKSRGWPAA